MAIFNRIKTRLSKQSTQLKTKYEPPAPTLRVEKTLIDCEEDEYELLEIEITPAHIICPDCGGVTLEGLDYCDKCGGEIL